MRTSISQQFLAFCEEFFLFGLKEARACIFAGSFFVLLFLSKILPLGALPRYDFLFLGALAIQAALIFSKLETKDELKVICLFHLIGLCLELFKTSPQIAAWSYPEPGFFKVATVPLYSGFMYAAVASYIIQAWRVLKLKVEMYPPLAMTLPLIILIYGNFFTKHFFFPDIRWWLVGAVFLTFLRTTVYFTVQKKERCMPLALSFMLIGFFIWVAENISTFLGAWQYPHQQSGWNIVSFEKMCAWFLLVIVSFFIVVELKKVKLSTAS